MRASEVFVAGGLPTITYVKRENLDLEDDLFAEICEGYKIICVTGQTKSGKTVLCKKVLGATPTIWLSGGQISDSKDCWEQIVGKLSIPTEESYTQRSETEAGMRALIQFRAKVDSGTSYTLTHNLTSRSLEFARTQGTCIVVDDFHYIPSDVQRELIRSVKSEVFEGLKVVLISVPHHAFAAVSVAKEMEGRFAQIEIPKWDSHELKKIATMGFPHLNMIVDEKTTKDFAEESFGSPLLMQRFCLRLCMAYEIEGRLTAERQINPSDNKRSDIFSKVAKQFGLPAYRKLLAGPQSRKDRIQRRLKAGGEADIYKCILYAIAKTGPKSEITYNEIRSTLQEILAEQDVPQKNQITNAISHMVKIAVEKIDGEPVVDWKEDVLYITDPFLMFYMRWVIRMEVPDSKPGQTLHKFLLSIDRLLANEVIFRLKD